MSLNIFSMRLDGVGRGHLRTISTCAIFLAIASAIDIAATLYTMIARLGYGGSIYTVIQIAIKVALALLMFNFGRRVRSGLSSANMREVETGVVSLKNYYSILMVLIVVVGSLAILAALIFGALWSAH